jgi:undecaprenyl diphosphate synthase
MATSSERLVPAHVALIMDGNGRWAAARDLPRTAGHEAGERALLDVIEGALELGVRYLSAYAFSTENWSRPRDEVEFLLGFNRMLLRARRDYLNSLGVRIRLIGRKDSCPEGFEELFADVVAEFTEAETMTATNDKLDLLVCFNYGARSELEDAAAKGSIADNLYAPDVPDVDLLIRTSGERRISNFLLWQVAYAELYFTETTWPDFDRHALERAIDDYSARERRFGGLT